MRRETILDSVSDVLGERSPRGIQVEMVSSLEPSRQTRTNVQKDRRDLKPWEGMRLPSK